MQTKCCEPPPDFRNCRLRSMPTAKPLILLVEDDRVLAESVAEELTAAGMTPHLFFDGAPVMGFLERNFVNLILLDVGLPDVSGFDLLDTLRAQGHRTPIIFLTGNAEDSDRVRGLDLGADDYLAKPFHVPELLARIRAVLRRTETARDFHVTETLDLLEKPFAFAGAIVYPKRLTMTFGNGHKVPIGKKELGIVHYLATHPGEAIPRAALIHAVWGIHADLKSRSIDQYIVKIRSILAQHGGDPDLLKTVHGVGYLFGKPPLEALAHPAAPEAARATASAVHGH